MAGKNQKYTQEFKQTIVDLYHSGKTYNQIKEEYGISHNALANWIKQYSEVKIDDNTVLTAKQIKELQKRNAQLEEENLILKKSHCDIHATLKQRPKAVELLSGEHKITTLCRVLNVNRSTYYKYINHTRLQKPQYPFYGLYLCRQRYSGRLLLPPLFRV